jgi:protein involved in polysaccharide export with SLBB domain
VLLGQKAVTAHKAGPGDVLGIWIDGVLGDRTQPLPVHVNTGPVARDQRRVIPALGYPVTVQPDGQIRLPLIDGIKIEGLNLIEVEDSIRKAYIDKLLLKAGAERVVVTLMQPRHVQVVVMRQEASQFTPGFGQEGTLTASKRGSGHLVELPIYENDVLHALTQSGGLPGLDAYNEIQIHRGAFRSDREAAEAMRAFQTGGRVPQAVDVIHIPLRSRNDEPLPFRPEDVILQSGDVVYLEARDHDVFYGAGLLPPGEYILPRDRDLNVIEAISRIRGPMVNGGFATSNLSGALIQPGVGGPSPTVLVVLRRLPDGRQIPIRVDLKRAMRDPQERILVRPGDVLVLQETPEESLTRYITNSFLNFNLVWQPLHERYATGVFDLATPGRLTDRLQGTPPGR